MAETNTSGGQSKSRLVLGDLTNRIGKRGFSGREKNGVKCFDFNDKGEVKRVCVSPRPCSEINSLKGNVVSGLSKVPSENRDPNVSGFGSGYAASKSSADVANDCDGGHSVKGKSRFHGGNDDIKNLDLRGGNVVSQSVNELDVVDNDLGDSRDQIVHSKDAPKSADKERGKVLNYTANEADDCGRLELDSSKENKNLGIAAKIANENKCPDLEHSVRKDVVDLTIIGGCEFVQGSSEIDDKENDPNSINTEAEDELGDSFSADTSKTVSETGNDCVRDGKNCDAGEVNLSLEGTHSDINSHHNDLDDHNADNFVLSESGSIDCTILPESQESRVFGIDGSTKLKEDACAQMTEGTNSIGACSCSFCTKALKKIQKDASILAERSCRIKANEKHGPESVTRVSKLESHLMYQWRSLFKYMSNIWEEEGNQLEASLLQLNNLREKCKADLELFNANQPEKN